MKDVSLSLVVPALNEEKVLDGVVREIHDTVLHLVREFEIILVNDGSTDETGAIMDRLAMELSFVRVLHNSVNMGLGASYNRGYLEATKNYVQQLCGDGGLPASSLPAIIDKIGTADIVAPYMTNMPEIKTPLRLFTSWGYTTLLNLLFGLRLRYYNGLPVYRRDQLQNIDFKSSGFGYSADIMVKLIKRGASVTQVGVLGGAGKPKSSALKLYNLGSCVKMILMLLIQVYLLRRDNSTPAAGGHVPWAAPTPNHQK